MIILLYLLGYMVSFMLYFRLEQKEHIIWYRQKGQISEAQEEFWNLFWIPFFWPIFMLAIPVWPIIIMFDWVEENIIVPSPFEWIAEKLEPFTDYIIDNWIDG